MITGMPATDPTDPSRLLLPDLLARLDGDPETKDWLASLRALGEPEIVFGLPAAADLPPLLDQLAIPAEDAADLVALSPSRAETPGWWWLLERAAWSLYLATGPADDAVHLPAMPAALGPAGRYFPAYVFLAMVPHTLALHRARGISSEVSSLTLADLGRQHMARYRIWFGAGGMDPWPTRHLQGKFFQLGRLQFERVHLTERIAEAIRATGRPQQAGDLALSVHIPWRSGPMSPEACDESLAQAGEFFARHFPEDRFDLAICQSWMLDPQLAEYLPPESNIVRFQRRFQLAYQLDDDALLQTFVFGRTFESPDEMPASTTLERAIADHLRSGRSWYGGLGWFPLGS